MKNKGKTVKKPNISLRRKIAIIHSRIVFILKLLIIGFVLLFFSTNYFSNFKIAFTNRIYDFSSSIGFNVKTIVISGNINFTNKEIINAMSVKVGYPIFKIKLKKILNDLERSPWVKNVIIKRNLPKTILVVLKEKEPIAIWQINKQLFLIDKEGNVITENYNNKKFNYLPHVVGPGANIHVQDLLDKLIKIPEINKHISSAVRCENRRWDLNFIQNITVKMPENNKDFNNALEYLSNLHNKQKLFDQNYKTLDLRDSNKQYLEFY